jgi:hypothetical protein
MWRSRRSEFISTRPSTSPYASQGIAASRSIVVSKFMVEKAQARALLESNGLKPEPRRVALSSIAASLTCQLGHNMRVTARRLKCRDGDIKGRRRTLAGSDRIVKALREHQCLFVADVIDHADDERRECRS